MTQAAADRRAQRAELFPTVHQYLKTRSSMRFGCRPSQLRAGARQLTFRIVARVRKLEQATA